jgi:hypothetical protein
VSTITPDLKKETQVPSIPEPTPQNLLEVVRTLKELLEIREGVTGDPLDQLVTIRDLYAMGGLPMSAVNRQLYARIPGFGLLFMKPIASISPEYAPPPAPTNFAANGALANVLLTWDKAAYHGHAYTEVWRAASDDLGVAVLIGTTDSSVYADNIGVTGATRYYWIRHISNQSVPGPFNGTAGTSGSTGFVITADLQDLLITAEKLAAGAVIEDKILDGAVVTTKIEDAAITSAKIGAAAVGTAAIQNLAVTTALIADAAVVNAKIGNLAVDTAQIADLAVATGKIADLSVTTGKIENAAITNAKIEDAAITNAKIDDAEITNAKIADATIQGAKIANATITGALLVDGTITGGKISSATTITAGSGDDVAVLDGSHATYRIYAGDSDPTAAPFAVEKDGSVHIRSGTSGERLEIENNVIRVYDSGDVLRVKIGDLS